METNMFLWARKITTSTQITVYTYESYFFNKNKPVFGNTQAIFFLHTTIYIKKNSAKWVRVISFYMIRFK